MEFTYAYKTSDGVRHTAEIAARSREEVFESLREQGIRPIKVVAKDGSKANGSSDKRFRARVVVVIVLSVLLLGTALGVLLGRRSSQSVQTFKVWQYSEEERLAFDALMKKADAVNDNHKKDISHIGLERLQDINFIAATNDVGCLYKIAADSHKLIESARDELKTIFSDVAVSFPPDGLAVKDAQRVYGERMDALDAEEVALSNLKFAMALLDGNRTKWSIKDGRPVFLDARLARMYKYCKESIDTDSSTARWKKDFGTIESDIIEIPVNRP